MKRAISLLVCLGLLLGAGLLVAACGSACEDLASRICKCQPTRAKQDSCKLSIDAAKKNYSVSDSEEEACQQILDSGDCTCQALEAGDLEACGLSNDAQSVFD